LIDLIARVRKLGNEQTTIEIAHRRFRTRSAQRRAGGEQQSQIIHIIFIGGDAIGGREQGRQLDERWYARAIADDRQEWSAELFGKTQRTLARFVVDGEQAIDFVEGVRGAFLSFRTLPLGAAHQHAAPTIRCGVAERAEHRLAGMGMVRQVVQDQSGL